MSNFTSMLQAVNHYRYRSTIMLSTIILLAALSTSAIASLNGRAEFVPQIFERTSRPAGGWSLSLSTQESCPTDAPACGSAWCCPASLTCVPTSDADIAEACCPGGKTTSRPSFPLLSVLQREFFFNKIIGANSYHRTRLRLRLSSHPSLCRR